MSHGEDDQDDATGVADDAAARSRRSFLVRAGVACAGIAAVPSRVIGRTQGDQDEEVTPSEDLMREHGVLKRVLLVYEEAIRRIEGQRELPPGTLHQAADIIRTFIEDYHEKLEENYLFPRFEKAGRLTDLTRVLRDQHQSGRRLTEQIVRLASLPPSSESKSSGALRDAMHAFIRMYGPHEAREDTILFPALRTVFTRQELSTLGDDFEKKENALLGEDGFEKVVDRVASIEKTLGIYDLAQFTPR
jgi:hemerythrin-like domain-containing protein